MSRVSDGRIVGGNRVSFAREASTQVLLIAFESLFSGNPVAGFGVRVETLSGVRVHREAADAKRLFGLVGIGGWILSRAVATAVAADKHQRA